MQVLQRVEVVEEAAVVVLERQPQLVPAVAVDAAAERHHSD